MKICNTCGEEFENKFSFCPVDATPLNAQPVMSQSQQVDYEAPSSNDRAAGQFNSAVPRREFNVTMIGDAQLWQRLATELTFVSREVRSAWPSLRRDPIAFFRHEFVEHVKVLRRSISPQLLASSLSSIGLVLAAVLVVILAGHSKVKDPNAGLNGESEQDIAMLNFPNVDKPEGAGVGASKSNGRVGFNSGNGEGSNPEPKRSSGGGGGGNHDQTPAQVGKLPPPSEIQAPIPKFPPVVKMSLPVAGIDIDPLLSQNLPFDKYGDPRSKSTVPSNGPGDGGGMGSNRGMGIGEGDGPGVGPGKDGGIGGGPKSPGGGGPAGAPPGNNSDPNRTYRPQEVEQRARVISKPEPQYTEEARKADTTGTVILRVVFSRSGEVTNISTIKPLPYGLTEKAIAAARQIRFVPASRNGQPVSMYMQLEYNFNLY